MRRDEFPPAPCPIFNQAAGLRSATGSGTIILGFSNMEASGPGDTGWISISLADQLRKKPSPLRPCKRGATRGPQMAIAFGIAAVSDFLAMWTVIAPPLQVALDVVTAIVLFLILGRRWALLPGLVAEAIPGMGVFPVWVLVVLSIIIYDGIKKPHKL